MLGNGIKLSLALFRRHQALIWTTQCWLNSECRSEQDIVLPRLIHLQIAGHNLGSIGQLVLHHTPANLLPTPVRARDFISIPFLLGKCHETLDCFCTIVLNDISREAFFDFSCFSGKGKESLHCRL